MLGKLGSKLETSSAWGESKTQFAYSLGDIEVNWYIPVDQPEKLSLSPHGWIISNIDLPIPWRVK